MDKDEIEYSIKKALRHEFDVADAKRQIEIYHTAKYLRYEEEVEEMRSDILSDHNIKLN